MSTLGLQVDVPICSLRDPFAREYLESYTVPPPSTVYGMLLSMVGEENRFRHVGAALALALVREPARSTVIRTTWRFKSKHPPGQGDNKKPDYQVILTGLSFAVFVSSEHERGGQPVLTERLREALETPDRITRHGGLSFGESRDLVDSVRRLDTASTSARDVTWLVPNARGEFTLPVWPNHVGSRGTRWIRLGLEPGPLTVPEGERFILIEP